MHCAMFVRGYKKVSELTYSKIDAVVPTYLHRKIKNFMNRYKTQFLKLWTTEYFYYLLIIQLSIKK